MFGSPAMELLNAFLDVIDTLLTAIGWVVFWYTWVTPPPARRGLPPPRSPSRPDELDQFVRSAGAKRAGDGLA
jgi:hypothetical protein